MPNHTTTVTVNGVKHKTLKDIFPKTKTSLKILFIAKTPALKSVKVGHYLQGQHGQFFWNQLSEYGILKFKPNTFEDENLLDNNCGFTDIVKVPRNYGDEPTAEEYKAGLVKILKNINDYRPKVIVFVYKAVLDNILQHGFGVKEKSIYGVNPVLKDRFKSQVFVFPMMGTPCKREQRLQAMEDLKAITNGTFKQIKDLDKKKVVKQSKTIKSIRTTPNKNIQGQYNQVNKGSNFWIVVAILILLFVIYANLIYSD